jgi:hypothetical protein
VINELLQARKLELSLQVFPWLRSRPRCACGTVDPRLATVTVQQLINHRAGWGSRAASFDPVFKMRAIARRLGVRAGRRHGGHLAISRPDGLDLYFVVNTRNFGGAKAMGEASNDINRALDAARDSMTTN